MAFKTKAEKRAFKIGLLRGQKKNKGKASNKAFSSSSFDANDFFQAAVEYGRRGRRADR